jgi:uncharacterized membrane protein
VWLGIIGSGLGLWGSWTSWPGAALASPALVLLGLAGLAALWALPRFFANGMPWAALGAALLGVGIPQAVYIHVRQYYTTDSAAFDQKAARALLHGRNPYTTSMDSAAQLLHPASNFWTYLADGGHVTHVSYPAASFLLDVPAMALGFHHEIVDWMDLGAWLITGVLLFVLLPSSVRWLSVLVLMISAFGGAFSNGGTDALFLPFLVLAVWRWDRFGSAELGGLATWVGPIALGVACSIKQTPWFCLPILVIGVGLEANRRGQVPWRICIRYLAIVLTVFAAFNLPFVVWAPSAWVHGVLLPFAKPLVADGQGLVTVALHGLTGGVELTLLSVAGVLAYAALVAAFVLWYPRLKVAWLLLVPIVLFLPARSFSDYLIDFFPAALVGALTVASAPVRAPVEPGVVRRRWLALVAVGIPLAGVVAVCAVAFSSAPLQLSVARVRTSNATMRLDAVTVTVENLTGSTLTPHFMVALGSAHPTGFWTPTTGPGPFKLGPGATATVTLRPNSYTWSPTHGAYWLVEAYTVSPDALSTSPVQLWTLGKAGATT